MSFAWMIAILFFILAAMLNHALSSPLFASKPRSSLPFGCMLLAFLLIRIIIARFTEGYPSDMGCWEAWGNRIAQLGAQAFYSPDYFCDYPPGYLYILGFLSQLASLCHLPENGYCFLLKLPAVVADMGIAVLIYQYGKNRFRPVPACMLAGFFLLSPVFFYDSAVWGQIESILLFFLVLSIIQFSKERYCTGMIFYVLAVLIKPQGLLLAPLVLLALLNSRNLKTIFLGLLTGLASFLLLILPFSPAWQEETGVALLIHLFNPAWMIEKYLTTMASYPYFSVNAFNFYALLGLNWAPLTGEHQLLYSLIHSMVLSFGVVGAVCLYLKTKKEMRLWISGYFLFSFLYTFAFRMHERYLLIPTLFLLFGYLASGNRKLLWLFSGFSGIGFCNLYYILHLAQTTQLPPDYRIIFPIALAEVILFFISIWVIMQDFLLVFCKTPRFPKIDFPQCKQLLSGNPSGPRQSKMTTRDFLFLSGIMLIYTIVAYSHLGDKTAPQTYYQPTQAGETITLELKNTETITEIDYYCGVGDVSKQPGLLLTYSDDGETWHSFRSPVCQLKTVFYWEVQPLEESITAKYLRLTAESHDYMLFEVGFRDLNGTLIPLASSLSLTDEQNTVTNMPTYKNSTYFDEIYHPRTAFEHLNFLPYYETTHPPLGKLIMAIGIALFGMTPFGWRFMGTLTGILMLPLFYLFLKHLFKRTRYAVIGTLLFAFDFMHYSLTRLATIDSFPVLFIIGMYYFMYRFACNALKESVPMRKLLIPLGLSGLFMGLGCASKWTAVYAAAGLGIEFFTVLVLRFLRHRQSFWKFALKLFPWCLTFFVVIPAGIYTLSYLPISMVDGYGNVFEVMWENQKYMFQYHSSLTGTHPYSSPWYSWPFVYKPMWAYQAPNTSIPDGTIGCISIFQNPLLSWCSIAALGYSCVVGIRKRDTRVLFLLIGLLAQYLPWVWVSRYALQYHFFASMVFMILFVIYAMEDLELRFHNFGYISSAFTALCLLLFLLFYAVPSGVPVSRFWAESVLTWFDSWVFFI